MSNTPQPLQHLTIIWNGKLHIRDTWIDRVYLLYHREYEAQLPTRKAALAFAENARQLGYSNITTNGTTVRITTKHIERRIS